MASSSSCQRQQRLEGHSAGVLEAWRGLSRPSDPRIPDARLRAPIAQAKLCRGEAVSCSRGIHRGREVSMTTPWNHDAGGSDCAEPLRSAIRRARAAPRCSGRESRGGRESRPALRDRHRADWSPPTRIGDDFETSDITEPDVGDERILVGRMSDSTMCRRVRQANMSGPAVGSAPVLEDRHGRAIVSAAALASTERRMPARSSRNRAEIAVAFDAFEAGGGDVGVADGGVQASALVTCSPFRT